MYIAAISDKHPTQLEGLRCERCPFYLSVIYIHRVNPLLTRRSIQIAFQRTDYFVTEAKREDKKRNTKWNLNCFVISCIPMFVVFS